VALDFRGTAQGFANSITFAAVGIAQGELHFPGYIIDIKEVLINGERYQMRGRPYTTSDDGICTRVNLYNEWVRVIPEGIRVINPNWRPFVTPTPLNKQNIGRIETIEVIFDFVAP